MNTVLQGRDGGVGPEVGGDGADDEGVVSDGDRWRR